MRRRPVESTDGWLVYCPAEQSWIDAVLATGPQRSRLRPRLAAQPADCCAHLVSKASEQSLRRGVIAYAVMHEQHTDRGAALAPRARPARWRRAATAAAFRAAPSCAWRERRLACEQSRHRNFHKLLPLVLEPGSRASPVRKAVQTLRKSQAAEPRTPARPLHRLQPQQRVQ